MEINLTPKSTHGVSSFRLIFIRVCPCWATFLPGFIVFQIAFPVGFLPPLKQQQHRRSAPLKPFLPCQCLPQLSHRQANNIIFRPH